MPLTSTRRQVEKAAVYHENNDQKRKEEAKRLKKNENEPESRKHMKIKTTCTRKHEELVVRARPNGEQNLKTRPKSNEQTLGL